MPEFLSFLITAILVLYIVRSLVRILLPFLFQNVVNNAQQPPTGGRQQNYTGGDKPGKITVDYIPESHKNIPDSEGEFVDYEEIKEPKK